MYLLHQAIEVRKMCNWRDITIYRETGNIQISAETIQVACNIILQCAQKKQTITYGELMNELKLRGCQKINRGTIGHIVGTVSEEVSRNTNPSIYPSAIVVRSSSSNPGAGFWTVDTGTNPPSKVPLTNRKNALKKYQDDVFNTPWGCNCIEEHRKEQYHSQSRGE